MKLFAQRGIRELRQARGVQGLTVRQSSDMFRSPCSQGSSRSSTCGYATPLSPNGPAGRRIRAQ